MSAATAVEPGAQSAVAARGTTLAAPAGRPAVAGTPATARLQLGGPGSGEGGPALPVVVLGATGAQGHEVRRDLVATAYHLYLELI